MALGQRIRQHASVGAAAARYLSPQSIDAIKASVDADLVRETHKLNSLMVLLTIAISGGPFLGLLGTVLGVMEAFHSIGVEGAGGFMPPVLFYVVQFAPTF